MTRSLPSDRAPSGGELSDPLFPRRSLGAWLGVGRALRNAANREVRCRECFARWPTAERSPSLMVGVDVAHLAKSNDSNSRFRTVGDLVEFFQVRYLVDRGALVRVSDGAPVVSLLLDRVSSGDLFLLFSHVDPIKLGRRLGVSTLSRWSRSGNGVVRGEDLSLTTPCGHTDGGVLIDTRAPQGPLISWTLAQLGFVDSCRPLSVRCPDLPLVTPCDEVPLPLLLNKPEIARPNPIPDLHTITCASMSDYQAVLRSERCAHPRLSKTVPIIACGLGEALLSDNLLIDELTDLPLGGKVRFWWCEDCCGSGCCFCQGSGVGPELYRVRLGSELLTELARRPLRSIVSPPTRRAQLALILSQLWFGEDSTLMSSAPLAAPVLASVISGSSNTLLFPELILSPQQISNGCRRLAEEGRKPTIVTWVSSLP